MLQNASKCFKMLQNASKCFKMLQNASKFSVIPQLSLHWMELLNWWVDPPSEFTCDLKNDHAMFTAEPHIMWSILKTAGLSWPFQPNNLTSSIFKPDKHRISGRFDLVSPGSSGGVSIGTAPSPFPSPLEGWKNDQWKMWSGSQEFKVGDFQSDCHVFLQDL